MYLQDCVCLQVCVFIWMSYALCVCVCVRLLAGGSKQKKNKTPKQNQNEQQNGIIIADILKNKQTQTVQGLWYYSDNKATFSRWVLSRSGVCWVFFSSSKRFSAVIASNGNREAKRATEEEAESWFASVSAASTDLPKASSGTGNRRGARLFLTQTLLYNRFPSSISLCLFE